MQRIQRCAAAFLLGGLLLGCGQTDRKMIGSQSLTGGSGAGGSPPLPTGGAGPASGDESSASAPASCLYPARQVGPLDGAETDVTDYTTSSPFSISITNERWGGLAAAFDQNGDWVSDLLVRDRDAKRYRLLLSGRAPDVLAFSELDCDALRRLPYGRLFLRDLDADGVADFVIGVEQGVVAYLNHPDGLEQVLDFAFAQPNERAELINLEAVDLDADGRVELIAGFDRIQNTGSLAFETGVRSFFQSADGRFTAGDAVTSTWAEPAVDQVSYAYAGYFTVGRFGKTGTPSVIIGAYERQSSLPTALETRFAQGSQPQLLLSGTGADSIYQLFALPQAEGRDLLVVIGREAFHVIDLGDGPRELYEVALAYPGSWSHELGGGPESPRFYFVDIDRDGDEDFLERSTDYPAELSLHINLANAAFAAPQALSIGTAWHAEMPFVAVGPASGIVDEVDTDALPGRIYTLYSSKYAAK